MRENSTCEDIVHFVAEQTKQPYEELFEAFVLSCQQMKLCAPHIPELLGRLRSKGVQVFITTDNMDCFTRWTIPALSLENRFDDIYNSYEMKVLKKDTNAKGESIFFQKILNDKNLDPSECLLLDDSERTAAIVKRSKIDFLLVNKAKPLEDHLEDLLRDYSMFKN